MMEDGNLLIELPEDDLVSVVRAYVSVIFDGQDVGMIMTMTVNNDDG